MLLKKLLNIDLLVGIASTAYLQHCVYINCWSLFRREFKGVETDSFLLLICWLDNFEWDGWILFASEIGLIVKSNLHNNIHKFKKDAVLSWYHLFRSTGVLGFFIIVSSDLNIRKATSKFISLFWCAWFHWLPRLTKPFFLVSRRNLFNTFSKLSENKDWFFFV